MKGEILNIEDNKKMLVLKALQKYKNQQDAAAALKISQATMNRLTGRYKIFKRDGQYYDRAAEARSYAP